MKTQSGRSMIEMLGVLAVVGILSALSLWGFRTAMAKHCANTLLEAGQQRARTLFTQRVLNRPYNLNEYSDQETPGCGTISTTPITDLAGEIGLTVNNVRPAVCKELINKITDTSTLRALVDPDDVDVELQADDCDDLNDIALIYNQDLGNGQPCETADDCETICALCVENMCTHECEEPEEDVACEEDSDCQEDFGVCGGCSEDHVCEQACEPVDWVQSKGSSKMSTGIKDNLAKNFVQIDALLSTSKAATTRELMGFTGAYTDYFGLSATNKWQCGGGYLTTAVSATPGEIFHIRFVRNAKGKGGGTLTVFDEGGTQLATTTDLTTDLGWQNSPLYVFGIAHGYSTSVIRIHEMQVSMDGALIAYFLPVLSPDDKPCLYEKLTDKLLCNTGWDYGYVD